MQRRRKSQNPQGRGPLLEQLLEPSSGVHPALLGTVSTPSNVRPASSDTAPPLSDAAPNASAASPARPLPGDARAGADLLEQHIGIDEAGRGCLAGPVTAAAVLFPPGFDFAKHLPGVGDSKALTEKKRNALAPAIRRAALAYGVGMAWPGEIDRVNILNATFRAMSRAVFLLARRLPEGARLPCLYIDGNHAISAAHWQAAWARAAKRSCPFELPPLPAQRPIVDGDALVPAISAASILAKTARDRLMQKLDALFPGYGFAQHKGYGTREHLAALTRLSPSPVHRLTFRKVRPEDFQPLLPGL